MSKLSLAVWALVPFLAVACASTPVPPPQVGTPAPSDTWYFAVSGDSRDCGDLIMPKIARAIVDDRAAHPASFYWHLGDFRRMFGPDCDIIKRTHPDFDCKNRPEEQLGDGQMNRYLDQAWDDFITHQVGPFGNMPVFLGIGNHELGAGRTREEFQRKFQRWLTSQPIHLQRLAEAKNHFYTTEGDTSYHFVQNGVDFVYLDNADEKSFTNDQLKWLEKVLANDAADPKIRTIVAGMHEALPYSLESGHAMDATCQGLCSGQRAYDLLEKAKLAGKEVYVLASHSHLFRTDLFNTPKHRDHVLPGWIIGTAGAEQYTDIIHYGYALVAVHSDGTLDVSFREVARTSRLSPPAPEASSSPSSASPRTRGTPATARSRVPATAAPRLPDRVTGG